MKPETTFPLLVSSSSLSPLVFSPLPLTPLSPNLWHPWTFVCGHLSWRNLTQHPLSSPPSSCSLPLPISSFCSFLYYCIIARALSSAGFSFLSSSCSCSHWLALCPHTRYCPVEIIFLWQFYHFNPEVAVPPPHLGPWYCPWYQTSGLEPNPLCLNPFSNLFKHFTIPKLPDLSSCLCALFCLCACQGKCHVSLL